MYFAYDGQLCVGLTFSTLRWLHGARFAFTYFTLHCFYSLTCLPTGNVLESIARIWDKNYTNECGCIRDTVEKARFCWTWRWHVLLISQSIIDWLINWLILSFCVIISRWCTICERLSVSDILLVLCLWMRPTLSTAIHFCVALATKLCLGDLFTHFSSWCP